MSAFSERHVRAVESIRGIWPGADFVVIGGLAVAHHTGMRWRVTRDLDLAIALQVEDFPGPLSDMQAWGSDPRGREHRKVFEGNLLVDFLPVGSALEGSGTITWPTSRQSMTIVGFDLAFQHRSEITIGVDTRVSVADLPVVLLLKMVAFSDNPADRIKDLHDILSVLVWNEDAAGVRLYDERFVELDLRPDEAAAFLIGEEVRAISDATCLGKIEEFFAAADKGHLGLLPMRAGLDSDTIDRLWATLRAGIRASER